MSQWKRSTVCQSIWSPTVRRAGPRFCSSRRALRPMNGPLFAASVQSRLSSNGEYICAAMTALRQGMYSTSARTSPASIRAIPRASRPRVLEPFQIRLRGRHPEGAVPEIPERAVVDRLAAFIAPWRVVDLSLREFRGIAGDDLVHEVKGILPVDQVLVERRDVEQSRGVADRVILPLPGEGGRGGRQISGPSPPLPPVAQSLRPQMKRGTAPHDSSSGRARTANKRYNPSPVTSRGPP